MSHNPKDVAAWEVTQADDTKVTVMASGFGVTGDYLVLVDANEDAVDIFYKPKRAKPNRDVVGSA